MIEGKEGCTQLSRQAGSGDGRPEHAARHVLSLAAYKMGCFALVVCLEWVESYVGCNGLDGWSIEWFSSSATADLYDRAVISMRLCGPPSATTMP